MRLIFFGTPEFAVPALERLLASRHAVAAVVSQPDRPSGRARKVTPPPVKERTQSAGVPLLQPEQPGDPGFLQILGRSAADCAVVVAYGRILPAALLQLFPRGCWNLHASLLPKYRGAAPIQWALIRGEKETGVTMFQLDEELDHGPVLLQRRCPIEPEDDGITLARKLSQLGAEVILEGLDLLDRGGERPTPQDHAAATLAPRLTKQDGVIDWGKEAAAIHNLVRGVQPWPGAATWLGNKLLKILATRVEPAPKGPIADPGTVVSAAPADGLRVQTGKDHLRIIQLQPEGGTSLDAASFLRGRPVPPGTRLASQPP